MNKKTMAAAAILLWFVGACAKKEHLEELEKAEEQAIPEGLHKSTRHSIKD